MKILKPAKNEKWSHKFVCSGCGAELEAAESDLQPHGYRGSAGTCAFLECITPNCHEKVGFAHNDLPTPVFNRLDARRGERPQPGPKD